MHRHPTTTLPGLVFPLCAWVLASCADSSGGATAMPAADAAAGSGGTAGPSAADAAAGSGGPVTGGGPDAAEDAAVVAVTPCSALPAPGAWQNISPPGIVDATAVVVDPFDPATVWLGTTDNGLFKSLDCGATWTHVRTGRMAAVINTKGQGLLSMAVDPADRGVIYVAKYGGHGLLKSTNGGVDWEQLLPPESEVARVVQYNFIDSVAMDPHDHRHIVLGTHADCAAPYAPACEPETTDAGATWRIVKLPTRGWEEGAGPWVLDAASWLYAGNSGLWLTTDRGASWKDVTPAGASAFQGGEVENHTIPRGSDGTYYLTSLQGIVRSPDGHTWSRIATGPGRKVGFAIGNGHLYTSDQWSGSYETAAESDPTKWTALPTPPPPGDKGAPYLAYDAAHHLLYSSNFAGGAWRMVTP